MITRTAERPRKMRRVGPEVLGPMGCAALVAACSGQTTGATHVTDSSAALNGAGSCDSGQTCENPQEVRMHHGFARRTRISALLGALALLLAACSGNTTPVTNVAPSVSPTATTAYLSAAGNCGSGDGTCYFDLGYKVKGSGSWQYTPMKSVGNTGGTIQFQELATGLLPSTTYIEETCGLPNQSSQPAQSQLACVDSTGQAAQGQTEPGDIPDSDPNATTFTTLATGGDYPYVACADAFLVNGAFNGCQSGASFWNTAISSSPKVDANSTAYINSILLNTNFGSDPSQFTFPVYIVNSSTPQTPVSVSRYYHDTEENTQGTGQVCNSDPAGSYSFPIPAGALPANNLSGDDNQIILWNPATGDEWEGWHVDVTNGSWTAEHWYHYNTQWTGVPPSGCGMRGAGLAYLGGLIRPWEAEAGQINHALAFSYSYTSNGNSSPQFVAPASSGDGQTSSCTSSNGSCLPLPEGAHLQLDPSIPDSTITSWTSVGGGSTHTCTANPLTVCYMVAKALQKYGAYVTDTAGHPKLYFEYAEGGTGASAFWGAGNAPSVSAYTINPIEKGLASFRVVCSGVDVCP
jgi:hypothetical protein